ncbi:MAG: 50S ribosomal protein L25 [Acidimicrobiia bacterium]|jgi:large subunit ribosomal protein L25
MPDDVVLIAEPRSDRGSGPAGRLRREGRLPAVVYGLGGDAAAVTVPAHDLNLILAKGVNSLITLRIEGKDELALARQVQRHPVRNELLHVDFVRVSVDVAITADVALLLEGEPVGVRNGGLLEQQLFSIPVEAKPQDIPGSIELDVSHMDLGDQLRVGELPLPAGVVTTLEADALVAAITIPRGLLGEGEGEGEEGEEGASAPAADGEGAASSEE